jgi:hypothetical protein
MRKLLMSVAILLLPLLSFADFQIGPTIQYKTPISPDSQIPGKNSISINDFSFGADARLNLSLFQAAGYGLFTPGDSTINRPASAKLYLDGGICVDIAIFRLGVGIGPNFIFNFNTDAISPQVNGNIRFAFDVMLGDIAVSAVYLIEANLTPSGVHSAFHDISGQLGLSVLFKIF